MWAIEDASKPKAWRSGQLGMSASVYRAWPRSTTEALKKVGLMSLGEVLRL